MILLSSLSRQLSSLLETIDKMQAYNHDYSIHTTPTARICQLGYRDEERRNSRTIPQFPIISLNDSIHAVTVSRLWASATLPVTCNLLNRFAFVSDIT